VTTSEILGKLHNVKRVHPGSWTARCPAHADKTPSLSVKEEAEKTLLYCHAGCAVDEILTALGLTAADLFDHPPAADKGRQRKGRQRLGLTVDDYADAKQLPPGFLRNLGLKDTEYRGKPAVEIAYLGANQKALAQRFRVAMSGDKFRWKTGSKVAPYGLWRLAEAQERGYITTVEGESDALTLWFHGQPALGIPGVDTWRNEWPEYFDGIPKINAWIEPGAGGRKLQQRLAQSPIRDRLWFITAGDVKDPSELHCKNPGGFDRQWADLVAGAVQACQLVGPILNELVAFVRRFVILSEAQARAAALWVAHTHSFDVTLSYYTPYLNISSAEKQSGKSLLIEVLETVVARPWKTDRVTAAALVRRIDAEGPTLLFDEADANFRSDKEYAETLRGILNSGNHRSGTYSCCIGQGNSIAYKDFRTFCPKAIAGIGALPDTVADRSIPIRMKPKSGDEKTARFRRRKVESEAARLNSRLQAWGAGAVQALSAAEPELPDSLTDRQQDGAEPLLAIADMAAGEWKEWAREALKNIFANDQHRADRSIRVRLLADIRDIFEKHDVDGITSGELVRRLREIEISPWAECKDKGLSQPGLAKLLEPFDIKPNRLPREVDEDARRGYLKQQFTDAFARYPLPQTVTPSQASNDAGSGHFQGVTAVTGQNCENSNKHAGCDGVTGQNGGEGATILDERAATCANTCYPVEPGRWIHHPWDGCTTIRVRNGDL